MSMIGLITAQSIKIEITSKSWPSFQRIEKFYFSVSIVSGKKWRLRKIKKGKVNNISIDKPISGSVDFPEDLAEVHSANFDDGISFLTKRGFLRFQKDYIPPNDISSSIVDIAKDLNFISPGTTNKSDIYSLTLSDSRVKYDLLSKIHKKFNHAIPNSIMHTINTIGSVIEFYKSPISTATPYDALQRVPNLPQNLHIQKNPIRFDSATDTMFGGVSAFPGQTNIVTGIRAKKKYRTTPLYLKSYR